MHSIEPFYSWQKFYNPYEDPRLPFFGHKPDYDQYTNEVYGYYLHPDWDFIGSETLYIKVLYVGYEAHFAVIELIGEWNDTLHNDIMYLKRKVVDPLLNSGVDKFVLIGENILNFHGSDDCYYEEWAEDMESDGWIIALNFRDFVKAEQEKYNIGQWMQFVDLAAWRTLKPGQFLQIIETYLMRYLE